MTKQQLIMATTLLVTLTSTAQANTALTNDTEGTMADSGRSEVTLDSTRSEATEQPQPSSAKHNSKGKMGHRWGIGYEYRMRHREEMMRMPRMERPERPIHPTHIERPERPLRPATPERPERPDRPERGGHH